MIFDIILLWFFSGIIFGFVDRILGKYSFILFLAALSYCIVGFSLGSSMDLQSIYNISNWWYIIFVPSCWVGMYLGKVVASEVKKRFS